MRLLFLVQRIFSCSFLRKIAETHAIGFFVYKCIFNTESYITGALMKCA